MEANTSFGINTDVIDENQLGVSVTKLADAGFITTWQGKNSNGNFDIYGKRFNADLEVVGSEFVINGLIIPSGPLVNLGANGNILTIDGSATVTDLSNIKEMYLNEYLLQIINPSDAVEFAIEGHQIRVDGMGANNADSRNAQAGSLISAINENSELRALGI